MLPGIRRYFKYSSIMTGITVCIVAFCIGMCSASSDAQAKPPRSSPKSKFYDFSDQLIDGKIKRPTALYTDARTKAKFDRLLKLKRSFMKELFDTAKEKVFK